MVVLFTLLPLLCCCDISLTVAVICMLYLLLLNFWCETHVLWFLVEESQRLGIRQSWCFYFVFGEQDKVKKDMKRSSRTLHCFVLSLMCARCDYKSEIFWQWQYLQYCKVYENHYQRFILLPPLVNTIWWNEPKLLRSAPEITLSGWKVSDVAWAHHM